MKVYLLLLIIIIIALVCTKRNKRLNSLALFVSFALFWLIASFRATSVGNDTLSYYSYFNLMVDGEKSIADIFNFKSLTGFATSEVIFKLYTYAISRFTVNFTTYLLITYGLIYSSIFIFIKKYSKDFLLSTLLYFSFFFFGSMSLMRQSLALSIILLGYELIKQQKLLQYLFLVITATLVHQTSIIMIIPYIVYKKRLTMKTVITYISITAYIFAIMNSAIFLVAALNHRYEFYLHRINSYSLGSVLFFLLLVMLNIIYLTAYKIGRQKKLGTQESNSTISFLQKISLMAMLCSVLAIRVNSLDRVVLFLLLYSVISIPNALNYIKGIRGQASASLAVGAISLAFCFIILILRPEWYSVTNYISVF